MTKKKFQKNVCIYFQVHQPYRLKECSFFQDIDDDNYFLGPQNYNNRDIFNKVADKCYIPATELFLELIKEHKDFRVAFSLSGVFLDQCLEFPEKGEKVLSLFQELAKTKQVEFLAETYFHSLSFLYSKFEFAEQIEQHSKKIKKLFGVKPTIFRNTELIFNNEIAEFVRQMGYRGILAEGWDKHIQTLSPNHLWFAKSLQLNQDDWKITQKFQVGKKVQDSLPILLKNYKLSDDIAFRFSNKDWSEHPLYIDKFASWLGQADGETINLFMDYETIGEHQWEDTGIFDFFRALPQELFKHQIGFHTPSEAIKQLKPKAEYDVHHYLSWADTERDLSAWLENDIQRSALNEVAELEKKTHQYKKSRNPKIKKILADFRRMQTSDPFHYTCTTYWSDGDVHKYFSPYESPYEAYITFMNTMTLLKRRFENFSKSF